MVLYSNPLQVIGSQLVTIAVLCVFTWSMYQFTLVTTATVAASEEGGGMVEPPLLEETTLDAYGRKVRFFNSLFYL